MKRLKTSLSLLALLATVLGAPLATKAADAPQGNAVQMELQVDVPKDAWRYQVYQNGIPLDPEKNYILTFWARASRPVEFSVSAKQSAPPWGFLGLNTSTYAGTEWKRYRMPFSAAKALPGQSRIAFAMKERNAVTIWIADVNLVPAGPEGKDAENLIKNPRFEESFSNWFNEGTKVGVYQTEVVTQQQIPAAQ